MAKNIAKYFIAIVPEGDIQTEATALKMEMKRVFNLKYSLKSPAHITLKMPFNWNENKEDVLIHRLKNLFINFETFNLELKGFGRFGKRVIYINVNESPPLISLQKDLSQFCKVKLNQVMELSDYAYHPHMTISFKDTKAKRFDEYWEFIQNLHFEKSLIVQNIALLKKPGPKWEVIQRFNFGN